MEQHNNNNNTNNNNKVLIQIPSYEQVTDTTHSNSTPHSLFVSSQTFSQAFAHLKSSEFYSPPPPPNNPTPSDTSVSRENSQSQPNVAQSSSASHSQNRNSILVSNRQKGNPLLKHIRNAKWAFADVLCDYVLGQGSCALYLSLRYHLLHPDYLYFRIREIPKNFKLRVVLCHVDVEDVTKPLLEVTKTALLHDCTLLCGWSLEECGRYLETIKVYENKSADIIQGQMDTDYLSRLNHALTTVRHVNKTDVVTLGTTFGSLSHIMDASMEDLARCPGIGERKVKRLHDTFHEPFKRVVPNNHSDPVPSSPQNDAEPVAVNEGEEQKETENVRKRKKKEPEVTVKSALSAAFAKYSDKVGKKNDSKSQGKRGEPTAATEMEAAADESLREQVKIHLTQS